MATERERRARLVDAALTVLATSGARALTHRAVDAAADLPNGSTSNVFRSRALLVDGVVQHLLELDRRRLTALGRNASGTAAAAFVAQGLEDRREVLARVALAADPDASVLRPARAHLVRTLDELTRDAGVPLQPGGAALLVAAIDGILVDAAVREITPDPAQVAAVVDAMSRALARPAAT